MGVSGWLKGMIQCAPFADVRGEPKGSEFLTRTPGCPAWAVGGRWNACTASRGCRTKVEGKIEADPHNLVPKALRICI